MVLYSFSFSLTRCNIRKLGFEKGYATEKREKKRSSTVEKKSHFPLCDLCEDGRSVRRAIFIRHLVLVLFHCDYHE